MWSSTRASCGFYMSLWGVLVWFDVEFMRSLCDFGVLWWFHEEFYWCLMWFYGWGMLGSWGFDVIMIVVWGLSIGISWDMFWSTTSQLEIFGRVDCSGESEPVLWGCRSNLQLEGGLLYNVVSWWTATWVVLMDVHPPKYGKNYGILNILDYNMGLHQSPCFFSNLGIQWGMIPTNNDRISYIIYLI